MTGQVIKLRSSANFNAKRSGNDSIDHGGIWTCNCGSQRMMFHADGCLQCAECEGFQYGYMPEPVKPRGA